MTDDEIKALLQRVPGASFRVVENLDMTVRLRSDVEAAGGNHDEVLAWVKDKHGYVDTYPEIPSNSTSDGPASPEQEFYAIPAVALA